MTVSPWEICPPVSILHERWGPTPSLHDPTVSLKMNRGACLIQVYGTLVQGHDGELEHSIAVLLLEELRPFSPFSL